MKKIGFLAAGSFCMIAGFIGLLLPVIPQVPFLAAGIIMLMLGSERFARKVRSTRIYRDHLKERIEKSRFLSDLLSDNKTASEDKNQ